jgi:hypothetical protein
MPEGGYSPTEISNSNNSTKVYKIINENNNSENWVSKSGRKNKYKKIEVEKRPSKKQKPNNQFDIQNGMESGSGIKGKGRGRPRLDKNTDDRAVTDKSGKRDGFRPRPMAMCGTYI